MPNASADFSLYVKADKPTTLPEIVEAILKSMPEADKTTIVTTDEEDLIQFHDNWGRSIRNGYNLWHDEVLVKALGAEHPDDASMIIIKAVWKALREPDRTAHR